MSDKSAQPSAELDALRAQLEEVQTRFDLVNRSASEGLWDMIYPADGVIGPQTPFWWSDKFRALLGYKDENDFPNVLDSWASSLHPEDRGPILEFFERHLKETTDTSYDMVYRLRLRSGEYRWFSAQGNTLRDAAGRPLRVAGSVKDIHDERLRAAELDAVLTRFELVNKSSSEGLWDMEYPADGNIGPNTPFYWNDQLRKLLGFKDEDDFPNVLDSWASRLHPEDKQRSLDAFAAHLNDYTGKTPFDIEYRLQLRDGSYRWFAARGTTLRDASGRPLRVAGSLKDIHDDKLRAAELKAAITRFELVNQSSSEGLWDMEYPADGNIGPNTPFWWNDQFRKLLGFKDENDFPNVLDSWASRLHPEDKQATLDAFAAHLNDYTGKTPFDREYRLLLRDGTTYRWFSALGTTLRDATGKPLRVAGSLKDIDDEKRRADNLDRSIGALVQRLAEQSREILNRSGAVAAGSQALSATTEEMNASVEELTASIHSIAESAKSTDALARGTQEEAEVGTQAISKAIEAMEVLRQSSEDMSEIVKVISDIASQTNLLAFNAAIEAARAGEHGLGFSVVADEVRKLAERSAQATKEISKLINGSIKLIVQGSEVSNQAGEAFTRIVNSIRQTGQAIAEVSSAAEEQLESVKMIAEAVQQVAEETEKSAAAAEGIDSSCRDLDAVSQSLSKAFQEFKQKG